MFNLLRRPPNARMYYLTATVFILFAASSFYYASAVNQSASNYATTSDVRGGQPLDEFDEVFAAEADHLHTDARVHIYLAAVAVAGGVIMMYRGSKAPR